MHVTKNLYIYKLVYVNVNNWGFWEQPYCESTLGEPADQIITLVFEHVSSQPFGQNYLQIDWLFLPLALKPNEKNALQSTTSTFTTESTNISTLGNLLFSSKNRLKVDFNIFARFLQTTLVILEKKQKNDAKNKDRKI